MTRNFMYQILVVCLIIVMLKLKEKYIFHL